jgi:hypothetical protein
MNRCFFICLVILVLIGCNKTVNKNATTTDPIESKIESNEINVFKQVLYDDNFPEFYGATKDDLINYFKEIGHIEWLHYEGSSNRDTSHFYVMEQRTVINYDRYLNSIDITDKQDHYFPSIDLEEAIIIAERFLPKITPPLKKNSVEFSFIKYTKTLEEIYFLPGDDYLETDNEIIYTAKFTSDITSKDFSSFHTAIKIHIKDGAIKNITIGGMQYSPPRLQKNYKLDHSIINDFNSLLSILNEGVDSKQFIEYVK